MEYNQCDLDNSIIYKIVAIKYLLGNVWLADNSDT